VNQTSETPWDRQREAIITDVRAIDPFDELERNDRMRALTWMTSTADIWRIAKPAVPPVHLISYFLVVDRQQVLLGDHINSGRWLPGGGHVEIGEHPLDTVRREAQEELGIEADFVYLAPLLISFVDTVGLTAGHTDASLWYVIRARREQPIRFDEREFRSVAWFDFDALPLNNTDPALARAIKKHRALTASARTD